MYEHRSAPLLPFRKFIRRFVRHAAVSCIILIGSLAIGVIGYHALEHLPWIDALLNASMILGGMGPVDELHTAAGKLFASFYALFSGVVFLVMAGIIIAPLAHRFLHKLHLEREGAQDH
jgi:hypothetical protein